MKFVDLVLTANRNLLRSKLRTVFTILAIFVGGFTLTLTTALNTGANQYLQRQLGNVAVPGIFEVIPKANLNFFSSNGPQEYDPNKKVSSAQSLLTGGLDNTDVTKLNKVDGTESVTPFYNMSPEYIQRGTGTKYQVTQLEQYFGLNLDLSAGSLPKSTDDHTLVLSEDYLSPLGLNATNAVGQKITIAYRDQSGKLQQASFTVEGVMKKSFLTSNTIFTDINSAKEIADAQGQGNRFLAIMVKFKNATDQTDESALKTKLQNAGDYTAMSLKERVGTITTVVDAITTGLNVVGIIALVAASFGIINTLLMSVYERTQEIGLMKSLGMSRGKVFGLFAVEAALVGFWGSVVAVGAATLASIGISNWASNNFLKDFEGFTLLVVSWQGALFVVVLIMLIAFVAGTFPAIKASRLNPIDALRSE